MATRTKRLFRVHRKGRTPYVGRDPLPSLESWMEQHRDRFKVGTLTEVVIEHDRDCRYPRGKPCTCRSGPEIRIKGERPEDN